MTFFDGDIREFSYPEFGFSDSATELWQEFYAFFFAYTTTRYQSLKITVLPRLGWTGLPGTKVSLFSLFVGLGDTSLI